jgi:hypothetical protein
MTYFHEVLETAEKKVRETFRLVGDNFLGNHRAPNTQVGGHVLEAYRMMRRNKSLKTYFLHSHLGSFPTNLGETFHRDVPVMGKHYQGKLNPPNYC